MSYKNDTTSSLNIVEESIKIKLSNVNKLNLLYKLRKLELILSKTKGKIKFKE
jgi:hypothetical protein